MPAASPSRPPPRAEALKAMGRAVIETEAEALTALLERIDDSFVQACRHMLACEGRIVVLGMGKSGHIGGKIAATLASTGSPAFFVHPGEASHGDLGMITPKDVVIAISNSGETAELTVIVPIIKRQGVPLIAMTGNPGSTLARFADVHLDISVAKEACPLGLAPTASTAATLAMGDALAVALLESRGFTAEDFARSHPGGSLGRRLLLRVDDIMQRGDQVPAVSPDASVGEAIVEISDKRLGFTTVVDERRHIIGLFTDGDLRRLLSQPAVDLAHTPISEVMTRGSKTIQTGALAAEAVELMDRFKVNGLPVVDADGVLVGALNIHDLFKAGVV